MMSMLFRCRASGSSTSPQALMPAELVMLIIVAVIGFVLPINYMFG